MVADNSNIGNPKSPKKSFSKENPVKLQEIQNLDF